MKKEKYVKPQAEVTEVEAMNVLAVSSAISDEKGNQQFLGRERGNFWDE